MSPAQPRTALPLALSLALLSTLPAAAEETPAAEASRSAPEPPPTVAHAIRGMEARPGLLTFYVDEPLGRIYLELPPPAGERGVVAEVIYVEGLAAGLGSNPVGLDRGQLAESKLLTLRRLGPKVLFEQPNLRYRALSENPDERLATRESFASSVIWGSEVAALDPDGRALVDLTPFLLRDAHGVVNTLLETEQGPFELDPERSAVDLAACLAFPDNLEFEAVLTYAAVEPPAPGDHLRDTVPTPDSVTLVQHQSFIRLPDDGYRPRRSDPRIGMYGSSFLDYAAPLDGPLRRGFIARHRLEKVDPGAERSPAVEPIVFYVDRGAPEPVRSALIEGASWWAEAFEAAGFEDAFRVEVQPPEVHPLDVRYNLIQWVHRSTRGWSYGGGVTDPRTDELIKGHVNLGSLRVRQDRLLFEGLAGTEHTGSGRSDDPIELALARIRQLAAHEVGHALGLTHNFAASTYGDRASVMDYPAPLVTVGPSGELDFSRAYGVGVGAWDVYTVRYAYSQFPPGADEEAELERIVREGLERGLLFLTDEDARPPGACDPRANLWDNGADPVAQLETTLEVRRLALERFGEHNVADGQPLAELEEVLAPVYFHHRYQLEAAAKVVGGMEYHYAVRGDGQEPTRIVDGARQRRALEVILGVLDPARLDLPEGVLRLLAPRPFTLPPSREQFATATAPAFDALGAAATAADTAVGHLLQGERLARLHDFHRRDPSLPGPEEVLTALLERAFGERGELPPRRAAIARAVERVVADRLMATAGAETSPPAVAAWTEWALRRIAERLAARPSADAAERAHGEHLAADVGRFLERAASVPPRAWTPPEMPPGSPIGGLGGGESPR